MKNKIITETISIKPGTTAVPHWDLPAIIRDWKLIDKIVKYLLKTS